MCLSQNNFNIPLVCSKNVTASSSFRSVPDEDLNVFDMPTQIITIQHNSVWIKIVSYLHWSSIDITIYPNNVYRKMCFRYSAFIKMSIFLFNTSSTNPFLIRKLGVKLKCSSRRFHVLSTNYSLDSIGRVCFLKVLSEDVSSVRHFVVLASGELFSKLFRIFLTLCWEDKI